MLNVDQFEEILIYFIKSIHEKSSENEIYWSLAQNCISKLGFVDCVIYSVQENSNQLKQVAVYGNNSVTTTSGKGILASVSLSGQAEIAKNSRYTKDNQLRSKITVPIVIKEKTIGLIDCEHPEKDYFTQQHLRILTTVATVCALKIGQLRSQQKAYIEQQKILTLQLEMSRLRLQAFHTQMNPHFVFNTLNAIQYFITENRHVAALDYLSTFSKLIRYYLKNIENEVISLKEEITMLQCYLKLQKLRYDNRFNYSVHTSGMEAVIPAFVLQTLIENNIEYSIYDYQNPFTLILDFQVDISTIITTITIQRSSQDVKTNYLPAYRERFADWTKHIEILNQVKKYNIQKRIYFNNSDSTDIRVFEVRLPNLL